MAVVHIDLFSLAGGRSVRMEWPTDLNEAEASEIIPWLDIIERKIQRRMNENERKPGTANGADGREPNPAGGKERELYT